MSPGIDPMDIWEALCYLSILGFLIAWMSTL